MASEVEDGREGFVVAPRRADVVAVALRALAADEGLRAEMGRHGRERARALSWDHNARRVLELGGREPVSD
jgi:glycosyltransferase involved in cell wall biosynthesis